VLDVDAAAAALQASYPGEGAPVQLQLGEARPQVTSGAVSRAMTRFADPAMSAPVTLVLGQQEVRLEPADYAVALAMVPRHGRLVAEVDGEALLGLLPRTSAEPVGRTVTVEHGRRTVVPARDGWTVDGEALAKVFLDVVATEGGPRRATVPTDPLVSTSTRSGRGSGRG
jgi:hypothetical protein